MHMEVVSFKTCQVFRTAGSKGTTYRRTILGKLNHSRTSRRTRGSIILRLFTKAQSCSLVGSMEIIQTLGDASERSAQSFEESDIINL